MTCVKTENKDTVIRIQSQNLHQCQTHLTHWYFWGAVYTYDCNMWDCHESNNSYLNTICVFANSISRDERVFAVYCGTTSEYPATSDDYAYFPFVNGRCHF